MRRLFARSCMILGGIFFIVGMTGCQSTREKERVEITWGMVEEDEDLLNQLKGIEKIEDATGVDITFQRLSEEEYNYMMASGKYPDVLISYLYNGEVLDLYNEGIAMEVTDLVEEHSVYLKQIYEQNADIYEEVQTNDGKLIYFPSLNPMQSAEDFYRVAYSGLIIRQDWLDKLGLDVPETIDDWYEVLTAFKTKDPNGNGIADEIPFDDSRLYVFSSAYGVLSGVYINTDGEVVYNYMEDGYKEYLMTMKKWYEEGLIGKSAVTGSAKWSEANIINNIAGSFYGLDNAWRYYLPSLQSVDENAQLTAVGITKAVDGKSYASAMNLKTHVRNRVTIMTKNCKNPEAVMKVIDYMYSQEGSDLLTWGIEGETYATGENGEKYFLPEALKSREEGYLELYYTAIAHVAFPKYDGEVAVLATYPEEQLTAEMTWADCDTSLIYPPNILFTSEDRKKVNGIIANIEQYASEKQMAYITGEESFDTYDEFQQTLIEMGIQEVIDIYKKNYEIYMTR